MEHFSQIERQVQIGSLRQIELLNRESSLKLMNEENFKYIYSFASTLELFPNNTAWGIGYILFGFQIVCSSEGGKIYTLLSAPEPLCIAEDYSVLNKIKAKKVRRICLKMKRHLLYVKRHWRKL